MSRIFGVCFFSFDQSPFAVRFACLLLAKNSISDYYPFAPRRCTVMRNVAPIARIPQSLMQYGNKTRIVHRFAILGFSCDLFHSIIELPRI